MAFCLHPDIAKKFQAAVKDGTFTPDKYRDQPDSEARRAFLENIIGKDDAKHVNALLESKLLLKDQRRGLMAAAEKLHAPNTPAARDMISRIQKMEKLLNPAEEKAFLRDAVSQKLGFSTSRLEAAKIVEHSKAVEDLKKQIPADSPIRSAERLRYGLALDEYHSYLNHLTGKDRQASLKSIIMHPSKWFMTVAGVTKGVLAAFDNSFFGRQGFKMMMTNPGTWGSAFVKSWGDIGKELVGIDAMKAIRADIFSRPNAINGKYHAGGYDLGIHFEEAFPSALPERIPLLGRLYKASESAFNGAALRMRADLADKVIARAEAGGINTLDPKQAEGLGRLVNSMTGRGHIVLAPKGIFSAESVNAAVFSVRFLKSNLDTLTAHMFDRSMPPATQAFVRKEAATNLLKIIGGTAAVLGTANALYPGSVDFDPRSARFGKITIGNTTIDVSGGMGSIVTLASRLVPTWHNGQRGLWTKSSTTGKYTDLLAGKYGQQNAMDVLMNFLEGKLSPVMGTIRDVLKGENYQGQTPTPGNVATNLITPLLAQTAEQLSYEPDGAARIAAMILDTLGFSANPPNPPRQRAGPGAGTFTKLSGLTALKGLKGLSGMP